MESGRKSGVPRVVTTWEYGLRRRILARTLWLVTADVIVGGLDVE